MVARVIGGWGFEVAGNLFLQDIFADMNAITNLPKNNTFLTGVNRLSTSCKFLAI
jgi:hypothetical protein